MAISLGMFDGVHKGHQQIIYQLGQKAQELGLELALLSFWPHPRLVFNPNDDVKLLSTLPEKKALLQQFGVQHIIIQEFNHDFINLSAEDFVKNFLLGELNVKYICIGHDHQFGKNKSGNFDLLKKLSQSHDFVAEQLQAVQNIETNISSTRIRKALSDGNIELANQMLGYNYSASGLVVKGDGIGEKLGYRTANIELDQLKLLPKDAAYLVKVEVLDQVFFGMMNIGNRPTMAGLKHQAEVFIHNFDEDIYGQNIKVEFVRFLREQQQFANIEALKAQLKKDAEVLEEWAGE